MPTHRTINNAPAPPCKNPCHCEGTKCPWQSVTPVPKATEKPRLGDSFPALPAGHTGLALQKCTAVGADAPVRPLYRAPYKTPVIAKPVRTPAVAIRIPVQLKNKHLTNPKNNPKMSVSFSSSRKRQRWGKGGDSPTRRESAAGASRWGSLAVLASELPA